MENVALTKWYINRAGQNGMDKRVQRGGEVDEKIILSVATKLIN